MQDEEKKMKMKKGCLAVRVGLEEGSGFRRFVIPISYLNHPLFKSLLERAKEVYGFPSSGPLKIPSSVDDFLHLLWLIERDPHHSSSGKHSSRQSQHPHQHHSLSIHSC